MDARIRYPSRPCLGLGSSVFIPGIASFGCATATAFLNRTSGLDAAHISAYTNLICGLVSDGVWSLLDALYVFATKDTTTAKLNLVSSSFTATESGAGTALTFTADRGYINPGPTGGNVRFLNTNYNPTTAAGNFVQNAAHVSAWSANSSTTTDGQPIFSYNDGGGAQTNMYLKFTDNNMYSRCNDAAGSAGFANSNRQGFWLSNRSSSTARQVYLNGAVASALGANTSGAPVNTNFLFLTDGQGVSSDIQDTVSAGSIGGNLSAANVTLFYNRLRTYMTAVGVP